MASNHASAGYPTGCRGSGGEQTHSPIGDQVGMAPLGGNHPNIPKPTAKPSAPHAATSPRPPTLGSRGTWSWGNPKLASTSTAPGGSPGGLHAPDQGSAPLAEPGSRAGGDAQPQSSCSAETHILPAAPKASVAAAQAHSSQGFSNLPACCGEVHLICAKAVFNLAHLLHFLIASVAGRSSRDRRASPTIAGSSWVAGGPQPVLRGHGTDVTPQTPCDFSPWRPSSSQIISGGLTPPCQGLCLPPCSLVGSVPALLPQQQPSGESKTPVFPKFAFSSAKCSLKLILVSPGHGPRTHTQPLLLCHPCATHVPHSHPSPSGMSLDRGLPRRLVPAPFHPLTLCGTGTVRGG